MTRKVILASSAFYLKWPSLTSEDRSRAERQGSWRRTFTTAGILLFGCCVEERAGPRPPRGPFPQPQALCLSWNKPAKVSKQCREELSIINWNHICKCVFKARELSQCPKSRLGNCLLRLASLPFLWTKQPQQLWEKRKTHANKPTSLFIFFTLNIKKQSFFKGWGKLEAFYVSILCSFCLLNRFLTNACSINPKLEILNF